MIFLSATLRPNVTTWIQMIFWAFYLIYRKSNGTIGFLRAKDMLHQEHAFDLKTNNRKI